MSRIDSLVERCAVIQTLAYCWRHGIWFGDRNRPECPECKEAGNA